MLSLYLCWFAPHMFYFGGPALCPLHFLLCNLEPSGRWTLGGLWTRRSRCRSMGKSGISHSKSCSCGRRELLQKSLNNHVFPLIYSKYLSRGRLEADADEAAEGWRLLGDAGAESQGNNTAAITSRHGSINRADLCISDTAATLNRLYSGTFTSVQ